MPDPTNDVKTDATSSVAPSEHDANAESSTAPKGETAGTPPAKTLAEAVAAVAAPAVGEAEADAESKGQELTSTAEGEQSSEAGEATDAEEASGESGQEAPPPPPVKDEDLPFGKHPRFQEIIKQRNDLRAKAEQAEQYVRYVDQLEQYKRKHQIDNDTFTQAMELSALVKNDPRAAAVKLREVLGALETVTGERLSPDLQAKLDEVKQRYESGLIDADTLKAAENTIRDVHKLRVDASKSEWQAKQQRQTAEQQAQLAITEALNAWTTSKTGSDPDFKPQPNGNAPGRFELVRSHFLSLWQAMPPASPQSAVALAERAYNEVYGLFGHVAKPQTKVLTTNASSKPRGLPAPKTLGEAIARAASGKRIIT